MSADNNVLLRRKKTGQDLDPAKLKAKQRASMSDGARSAKILAELPTMKLAVVRKHLRMRAMNPLGDLAETSERLRASLQDEVDAANAKVSSIQYRQAAREAREAGALPISNYYDPDTTDAVLGPLSQHATGRYNKPSKVRLKKDRKVKQRTIHEFDVPGGRMRAGFIHTVSKGWGHEALEFVTINDWPVKNVTWQVGRLVGWSVGRSVGGACLSLVVSANQATNQPNNSLSMN